MLKNLSKGVSRSEYLFLELWDYGGRILVALTAGQRDLFFFMSLIYSTSRLDGAFFVSLRPLVAQIRFFK